VHRISTGYGLISCQRPLEDPRDDATLYAEAIELAVEAERLGYDSAWVSEHHFLDDAYMPSVLPVLAAMAAQTTSIRLGTALLLAPLIHPLRLAEDAATVDLISNGRLELGLGLGWRDEELDALGVTQRSRVRRLQEAIAVLRAGADDDGTPVVPHRPDVPITIGALAEPAVRRAGRIADGFMATDVTPEQLREQVSWAREERAQNGGDPDTLRVLLHLPTFAWPDADAWERVRDAHWYVTWKYEDMDGARGRGPRAQVATPPLPAAREQELRDTIILGEPEAVAERIRAYADAAGGTLEYIARLYWPGMDLALQREAQAVFAQDVAPLLRVG
jgi:alkanesulfonate monooxygenase SsuD/methylene tetrahydromethanopterin reductase-like flavin-dependent oxidoreductase (luciferase family)